MQITVKTAGLLGRYLPAGAAANQTELDIASDATPADVIELLNMPADDFYLIMINGVVVPSGKRSDFLLRENDLLGIFPPLKGG